jgi:Trypsin
VQKIFLAFLLIISLLLSDRVIAATFKTEPRRYFKSYEQIGSWPYNIVVQLLGSTTYPDLFYKNTIPFGVCTGVLVSPNGCVLTAGHCYDNIGGDGIVKVRMFSTKYNEIVASGKVVGGENVNGDCSTKDYLVIKLDTSDSIVNETLKGMRYPELPKQIDKSKYSTLMSVGFGSLRVLSDQDIDLTIDKAIAYTKNFIKKNSPDADLRKETRDSIRSKIEQNVIQSDNRTILDIVNEKFTEEGRIPLTPDVNNAKIDSNCKFSEISTNKADYKLSTSCMTWSGDSGGPIIAKTNTGNYAVIGVLSCDVRTINMKKGGSWYVEPDAYYDKLMDCINSK